MKQATKRIVRLVSDRPSGFFPSLAVAVVICCSMPSASAALDESPRWPQEVRPSNTAAAASFEGLRQLRRIYEHGLSWSTVYDYAEAVAWYRRAAAGGHPRAQVNLGILYLDGRGGAVTRNAKQAVVLFRRAADRGDAEGQFWMGVVYAGGEGVSQDEAQAVEWWRRAAEQGHAGAQNNAGWLLFRGSGVTRDGVEAYMWLSLAAARTSGESQRHTAARSDEVERELTPAQLAEAKKRAQEWLSRFETRKR
jgi:TPR repeat protein